MTIARRMLDRGFFVIFGLTVLLLLAGIVILPALGPSDSDPSKVHTSDDSFTSQGANEHAAKNQQNASLPGETYELHLR